MAKQHSEREISDEEENLKAVAQKTLNSQWRKCFTITVKSSKNVCILFAFFLKNKDFSVNYLHTLFYFAQETHRYLSKMYYQ